MKCFTMLLSLLATLNLLASDGFNPYSFIRCTEGDHDSKTLVIHKQDEGNRILSIAGGRDIADMGCKITNQEITCQYETSSFWRTRSNTLKLDLTSIHTNYELNDIDIKDYVLDGELNGDSLICKQDANW